MKNKILLLLIILSIIIIPSSLFAQEEDDNIEQIEKNEEDEKEEEKKKEKKDEKRLQFGFGIHVNSLNFTGMSEAHGILKAIKIDDDYTYPGISEEMEDSIQGLETWMQYGILDFS